MALFGSYESLDYFLQQFINRIDEIEGWHASWPTNERIQAGLKTVETGMTNKACLFILISAQSVHAAVQIVQTAESGTLSRFLADGIGIEQWGMLERFDDERGVRWHGTESQLRVTFKVLRDARQAVQEFQNNLLDLLVREVMGQQGRLWLENYVTFHLEQMSDGFLMLRGLLEHDLGRRFADVPILIHRLDRTVSELKSIFMFPGPDSAQ